jgi:peptide/nickel transport system ATP-binding protein
MDLLPPRGVRWADKLVFEEQDLMKADESTMAGIRGRRMAMIFQEPMTSLDPCYTIGNQLEEAILEHQKIPSGQARERAVYLLEKVGITAASSRLKQYPHQLSGACVSV